MIFHSYVKLPEGIHKLSHVVFPFFPVAHGCGRLGRLPKPGDPNSKPKGRPGPCARQRCQSHSCIWDIKKMRFGMWWKMNVQFCNFWIYTVYIYSIVEYSSISQWIYYIILYIYIHLTEIQKKSWSGLEMCQLVSGWSAAIRFIGTKLCDH
jgi:hypothetical protein